MILSESERISTLQTAILFLVFNRPHTTRLVFNMIRKVKPQRLYVAADGARASQESEIKRVEAVRDYVMKNIDWKCEVKTLFRAKNLGCKQAISSAIDWFFDNEEEGIILEDDVVPKEEFFKFCEEGLKNWRSNESIAGIGGFVPTARGKPCLSVHGSIWGWATWKRAWDNYKSDQHLSKEGMGFLAKTSSVMNLAEKILISDLVKKNEVDTWDYYWLFSRISNHQYMVLPGTPLTTNIGFSNNAGTHLQGDKPLALQRADQLNVTKKSIDHNLIETSQSEVIAFDYSRVYARQGRQSFTNLLICLFRHPFLSSRLYILHFITLIRVFLFRNR